MAKSSLIKPYLKWAGGKRQLLTDLRQHMPQKFSRYYEPFVGAGALFFDIQPKKAVINDYNAQLILTYIAIKENVDELIELLASHKKKNNREYYYEMRELDRDATNFNRLSDTEKAARLIYLNRTCFNGLYRVNSQGLFNVPYGNYKNPMIYEEPVLKAISSYLSKNDIEIISGDYYAALRGVNKNCFVYFDPPYHSPKNTNFTGYQAGGFGESEQVRLKNTIDELTHKGVKCLMSNSDTDFIRELYSYYRVETVQATRAINANGDGRGLVNEVLVKNW